MLQNHLETEHLLLCAFSLFERDSSVMTIVNRARHKSFEQPGPQYPFYYLFHSF